MGKKPSSHIIHSLGGEYCWIVRGSEPIRLLKSPRSLNVYILSLFSHFWDKNKGFCTVIGVQHSSPSWTMSWWRIKRHILRTDLASSQFNKTKHSACAKQEHSNDNLTHCGSYGFKDQLLLVSLFLLAVFESVFFSRKHLHFWADMIFAILKRNGGTLRENVFCFPSGVNTVEILAYI